MSGDLWGEQTGSYEQWEQARDRRHRNVVISCLILISGVAGIVGYIFWAAS